MKVEDSYRIDKENFGVTLEIGGKNFSLVQVRAYDQGAIYRSDDGKFLRIGEESIVAAEQSTHEYFEARGFPMPRLLERGDHQGWKYYTETSVGENTLSKFFAEDFAQTGKISDENFAKLVAITEKFIQAQTETVDDISDDFFIRTQFPIIKEERPEFIPLLDRAIQKIQKDLEGIPLVPTHGDYNPANIFEKGVIDFSYHSFAPAGYDLACCLVNTYYFPKGVKPDFDMVRKSEYTDEQWQQIFDLGNGMYQKLSIPKNFQETFKAFAVARMCWSAARMENFTRRQAWRFEKLKDMLECYNTDGTFEELLAIIKR